MIELGTTTRRFTIGDGMILIAAMAVALAWTAPAWKQVQFPGSGAHVWGRAWKQTLLGTMMTMPTLLALTFATVLVRVRRPRRAWRLVSRQAGTTACLTVLIALVLATPVVGTLLTAYLHRDPSMSGEFYSLLASATLEILAIATGPLGLLVLVAWLLQVVQGTWRAERSWIDRLGRFVGVGWLVTGSILGAEVVRIYFFG